MALDTASNGNFMTNTVEEAHILIDNLASSNSNHCPEYDRTRRVNNIDTHKIDDLAIKVDLLLKRDQRAVNYCENIVAPLPVPMSSTPSPQDNKLEILMHQLLEGQEKHARDINVKVDNIYNDLNGKFETLSTHVVNLDNKFEALSSHVKKLDTQVAETAEIVQKLVGVLPEKMEQNLRSINHLNTTNQRSGKEISHCNTLIIESNEGGNHISIDDLVVNDAGIEVGNKEPIHMEPQPHISEDLNSLPPREPISAEKLACFYKMVKRLPSDILFEDAWEIRPLHQFFQNTSESLEEIKALFAKAWTLPPRRKKPSKRESENAATPLKQLSKLKDPGKFVVSCSIDGVHFEKSLCDSGSCINLMSKAIAQKLGIYNMQPSKIILGLGDSSTTIPLGTIYDLPVQVGNCLVPTDFEVVDMSKGSDRPLILGRSFLATVGAIVDMPNKRVSFSNIDKNVFYMVVPTNNSDIKLASCMTIISGEQSREQSEIKEILDGDPHITTNNASQKSKGNKKATCKRIEEDSYVTLIPQRCVGDAIKYKVKCKGRSKPFSKVRAIITSELKEKGEEAIQSFLDKVMMLKMTERKSCFRTSFHAHPP